MTCERYRGADSVPDGLLKLLGQKYTLRILHATTVDRASAGDIISEFEVPRTTVYRRLRCLEEHGLVWPEGRVDGGGDHDTVYHCNLDELRLAVEDDVAVCEVTYRDDPEERWASAWHRISDRDRDG